MCVNICMLTGVVTVNFEMRQNAISGFTEMRRTSSPARVDRLSFRKIFLDPSVLKENVGSVLKFLTSKYISIVKKL